MTPPPADDHEPGGSPTGDAHDPSLDRPLPSELPEPSGMTDADADADADPTSGGAGGHDSGAGDVPASSFAMPWERGRSGDEHDPHDPHPASTDGGTPPSDEYLDETEDMPQRQAGGHAMLHQPSPGFTEQVIGQVVTVFSVLDRILFRSRIVGYGLTLILFCVIMTLLHFGWSDNLPGVDAAYHIRMGEVYRERGPFAFSNGKYPWTRTSLFTDHWSDKEWLYHCALIPFTLGWTEPEPWMARTADPQIGPAIAVFEQPDGIKPEDRFEILAWENTLCTPIGEFIVEDTFAPQLPQLSKEMLARIPCGLSGKPVTGRIDWTRREFPLHGGFVLVHKSTGTRGWLVAPASGVVRIPTTATNANWPRPVGPDTKLAMLTGGKHAGTALLGDPLPMSEADTAIGSARFPFLVWHMQRSAAWPIDARTDDILRRLTFEDRRAYVDPTLEDVDELRDTLLRENDHYAPQLAGSVFIPGRGPFSGEDTLVKRGKLAAACMVGLLCTVLLFLFRENGVRWPWLFLSLLFVGGDTLWWRLFMTRPHVLSVAIMLLGLHFVLNRRRTAVFLLGVVYALAYTASHALIVLAAVVAIVRLLLWDTRPGPVDALRPGADPLRRIGPVSGRVFQFGSTDFTDARWKPPVWICAALGVVTGLLLHPNAFNTLHVWLIQNGAVYLSSFFKPIAEQLRNYINLGAWSEYLREVVTPHDFLRMGNELNSVEARRIATQLVPYWLPGLALVFGFMARGVRPRTTTLLTMATCVGFGWLFFTSQRFMEYAGPMAAVFYGFAASDLWSTTPFRQFFDEQPWRANLIVLPACALGIAVVIMGAGSAYNVVHGNDNPPDQREVALAMRSLLREQGYPDGAQVFCTDWHDFVGLLHYNTVDRYLVSLDPNFLYYYCPEVEGGEARKPGEVWRMWEDIRQGREQIEDPALRRAGQTNANRHWIDIVTSVFGSTVMCCEADRGALLNRLRASTRWKLIYEGSRFSVFVLLDEDASHGSKPPPGRLDLHGFGIPPENGGDNDNSDAGDENEN